MRGFGVAAAVAPSCKSLAEVWAAAGWSCGGGAPAEQ